MKPWRNRSKPGCARPPRPRPRPHPTCRRRSQRSPGPHEDAGPHERQEDPMKRALITGVTGQDGAYLAEFLLAKGYEVHGIKRRASSFNTARIDHIYEDPHNPSPHFILHYGDLTDSSSLIHIVQKVQPDEIYNLGAQSH